MCNRVRGVSKQILHDKFGDIIITDGGREVALDALPDRPEVSFAYDAPKLPVLTALSPQRWQYMRMKYLPHEASGNPDLQAKIGDLHNARTEGIFDRFSFKNSIRLRRCIIPLEGFYDFQGRGKKKNGKEDNQCYYLDLKDGELIYAAGVWDVCDGQEGFAILTTDANPLMQRIHNKNPRQPLIIGEKDWVRWFGPLSDAEIKAMFSIYPDANMKEQEYILPKPPPSKPPEPNGPPTLF